MNMLSLTSDLSALLKKKSKSEHTSTTLIDVNADECYKKDQKAKIINKCKVHVLNNGYCFLIATNRKIFHRVNEKISRPIRGSQRRAIMDKFKAGGSVYRVHAQYDEKRTIHEKKAFPHKKDSFPRPAIILSDHAALYVFNDENYSAILACAYRIFTNAAIRNDLSNTNIHAYLSHFILDMHKRVNEYLPEDVREISMWAIFVLNYVSNDNINFKQHHATLLSRISNITNDPNSSRAINQSKEILTNINDPFAFDDDNELDDYDHNPMNTYENIKTNNKRKRSTTSHLNSSNILINRSPLESIIDEEEELNKADSPLKQELQAIYNEWLTTCIKYNGAFSSFDKASKGTRQWLSHINQQCIPPIPIWSNILLGNLSRHGTSTVRAFDNLLLSSHNQRTNAMSERRMSIVKRTQLGIQTRCRSDVILEILVNDIKKMVEKFSILLMTTMFQDTDNETNSQQ
ncbi:unnamed protein product [Rotaria magnacalcarata]|uniref:Uncharacterized protein n=1 Tax=Rotaria magnacalcarata TaxID=392030 RepID=A0A816RMC8_9BILA|nr:unnamed protein product [Rotaria magnacalcarata]